MDCHILLNNSRSVSCHRGPRLCTSHHELYVTDLYHGNSVTHVIIVGCYIILSAYTASLIVSIVSSTVIPTDTSFK